MAYKLPAHLHRNRHGMLYFRLTIPQEYRPYIGVSELYRSLGTASVREAVPLALSLHNALRCAFSASDTRAMSESPAPPVIDLAALQATLKHAKKRHRQIDRIEELDQTVTELHRQRVQQQVQHKRELAIAIRQQP